MTQGDVMTDQEPTAPISDAVRQWVSANAHLINAIPSGSLHITWSGDRIDIKGPTRNTVVHLGQRPLQTR